MPCPWRGPQLRLLRELQRTYPDSPYVFVSERKAPLSPRSIREIVARTGKVAGLPFVPHPHQLRHAHATPARCRSLCRWAK